MVNINQLSNLFPSMATILLTWELGGNAGHVHPLGAIASELKGRGHKVLVAVKDVCTAERFLAEAGIEFVQAPVWLGSINPKTPFAVNFAELLMRVGYLTPDQVAGQIRSWMNLVKRVKPDLILANHSPSVLLAARIVVIKAMSFGSGFFSPPIAPLMPSIQPRGRVPRERLAASEKKTLTVLNQAIRQCGGAPLKMLSGILGTGGHYFITLPEADHYGARKNTRYWGVIHSSQNAAEPVWPKIEGPKVYVYMQHHSKPYRPLLESLRQLGWPSLIVSRNINQSEIWSLRAPNLTFSPELVNLEAVAQQADVVVTNCNHGTTLQMLQWGCRQLVIPLQVEQSMLAHRLSRQGLVVASDPGLSCYRELLEKTNDNPTLKSNVAKFNRIYGKMDPKKQLTALVDDIEGKVENFS
jgi:UDP:flavonoid glycosyltransferase YjiC (YdhE family)